MIVILGENFKKHFVNFPRQDRIKIFEFIEHIEQYGFDGLIGRNKASHNVPKDHPNWSERVKHAMDNNLWHYLRAEIAKHRFARSQDKSYARSGYSPL